MIEPSEQNSERWIATQSKWKELSIQGELDWNLVRAWTEEEKGEDHSSARDVKRARGEPEQDLSGEILFQVQMRR